MPLVNTRMNSSEDINVKDIWYADDGGAGGSLKDVREWWESLCKEGPLFGYHPKPQKSWLIVKPGLLQEGKAIFPDVNVTDIGHRYLGSYIGLEEGKENFVMEKVEKWIQDIEELSEIALRQPQLAYSAFVYGLSKRWNYVCRTTPGVSTLMKKLDFTVKEVFIPAILDRAFSCSDNIRSIFALPCRL